MQKQTKQVLILPNLRGNLLSANNSLELFNKLISYTPNQIYTQFGITMTKYIGDRMYVIHVPQNGCNIDEYNLLIHLHGSRGYCWNQALFKTRWIQKCKDKKLIVVFGQALGKAQQASIHAKYGGVAFGQRYWEIRDNYKDFQDDINYIKAIIAKIESNYKINKKFLSGHSNGGVFVCQAAIYMRGIFQGFYSSMGGIGHDLYFVLDFEKTPKQFKYSLPPKLYFYTGSEDVHRQPTLIAYKIFKDEGYDVVLEDEAGIEHLYQFAVEERVLNFWVKQSKLSQIKKNKKQQSDDSD